MSANAIDYTYKYLKPSSLQKNSNASIVDLSTFGGIEENPYFFQGALKFPRATALCLRILSNVVGARYHIPPAMLEKILREADPVVTCGGEMLRFEGFSGCCGVYARVDLEPDAYDGLIANHGTTNVDFNTPMVSALGQIRDHESVSLAVGTDDVTLLRGSDQIVERKVKLPQRWIRGFSEVQAYQARMQKIFEVSKIESMRFIRNLPANPDNKSVYYVVAAGRGLRLSKQPVGRSVKIAGLVRLRILEQLVHQCHSLLVYAEPEGETSLWELKLGPIRFTLTLSPETWRGFSGEGQALEALGQSQLDSLFNQARASLKWQAQLPIDEFSQNWNVQKKDVLYVLHKLGSQGLVGYDLSLNSYFHRELPFNLEQIEKLNPRLKGAKKLVDNKEIDITTQTDTRVEAYVKSSGVRHRVRFINGSWRCTCPWFAKYQGKRGPCKHVLATQMTLNKT